jgi:glyoxylase-like metal-dependent hydrolase (beta-lactamase superfamily II)
MFLHNAVLTATALSLPAKGLLALLLQQPPWKINMLDANTGLFTMSGGTMLFSKTKEGYIVVDSQFANNAKNLTDELKKNDEPVFKLLINTHHHLDHSGGNILFKDIVGNILAHENSKINQEKVAVERKIEDKQLYPDQTYADYHRRKVGNETVALYYFGAGHTNGDSIVHLEKANVVHMGDLVFNKIYPNIDRNAGASIKNWIHVLDKAYKKFNKKTKFICGHGQKPEDVIVDREFLKQKQFFLENLLTFVDIEAGKSKDEILQHTIIPGADEWKDNFKFIKVNLGVAYDELTSK